MRDLVHASKNLRGRERVATQREEIVVNTDLFNTQNLCPMFGEHFFKRCSWCDKGLRGRYWSHNIQFRRQAEPQRFARGAFGKLPDDDHLARDLEVGDAPDDELTDIIR